MAKSLWQLQSEGKVITTLDSTDLIYVLRDPVTGRFDRVITAADFAASLALGLDNLLDVIITAPTLNQVIKYNGVDWVNSSVSGSGATILNELNDVIIAAEVVGHILRHNGTNWINVLGTDHFAAVGHNHDATYSLLAHVHDDRYYTETEINTLLAGYAVVAHNHDAVYSLLTHNHDAVYSLLSHNHDTVYYTETEIDALLAAYSLLTHNHDADYAALAHVHTIDGLSDVTITTPSTGQVLKYNGTIWINDTDATGGGGGTLDDLTDVIITAAITGDILRFNGTNWVDYPDSNFASSGHNHDADYADIAHVHDLDALSDVVITTPSTGQVIKYNGTNWINDTDATGGGGGALDDLTDVALVAAATGDILRFNGTVWVDSPDSAYATSGHNHDATYSVLAHDHDADYAAITHNHDASYYTEGEIDTFLAGKSDIAHNHDADYADIAHNHTGVYQPVDSDLTTISGLTPTTDNILQSVAGAWASRTPAQVRTALALVVGTNVQAFSSVLQNTTASFLTADETKLDGIETAADVTDATNVAAAGAHMSGGTDIPVTDGGTGSSTAAGARTNLGAAASSHSHTSLKEKDYGVGGVLVVSTGVMRISFKRAVTITNVMATVNTAPTGASVIVDVNKNGTTIFTTQGNRPTIAVSTNNDLTAVPDVTAIAAGDYLTVDIDQIGSTVAGSDLTVTVEYTESIT